MWVWRGVGAGSGGRANSLLPELMTFPLVCSTTRSRHFELTGISEFVRTSCVSKNWTNYGMAMASKTTDPPNLRAFSESRRPVTVARL